MKRILPKKRFRILDLGFKHKKKVVLSLLLSCLLLLISISTSHAQIRPPYGGGLDIEVSGRVGELYLNLSGYASPLATVELYINNVFIRGTIADENGVFYIPQVLIKAGLTNFCLVMVDYRHVGRSESCFDIPPASATVDKKEVFLPPTLALSKGDIAEGEVTFAYGYTMPGAEVILHVGDNVFKLKADKNGYFRLELKGLKAGKYSVYATAKYKNFTSSSPAKKLTVHVLNWWEQFLRFLRDLWNSFIKLFTNWSLGPLWLVIPIIILIIILIIKLWKDKFTSFFGSILHFLFILIPRPRSKKLHHAWWVGY